MKIVDKNIVKLNTTQCKQIGKILKNLKFRPEFYQREFLTFQADKETKARVYFYCTAICHQTHTLINKKKNLKGWDCLEYVFTNLAGKQSKLLDPDYLVKLSVSELADKLRPLFAADGNPKNCTLDRLSERSRFLIESSKILKQKYKSRIMNIIKASNGFLLNKGKGFYEILSQFEAYKDPLKKKSSVFIKLLIDSGLLEIKDPQNFIPIIDYHMQRVLLRMGCVEIIGKELKKKLLNKERIESDEDIRRACMEAMKIISKTSGHEVAKMNDFFWPLGRSCCKEKTLCFDRQCNKNPCTFYLVVDLLSHQKCLFEGVCKASINEEYRKYWQPIVETHYY